MSDNDRDAQIAELLDERRRGDSTLRDADTLRQAHPELSDEVLRLAQIEDSLADAVRDWHAPAGDETISSAAVGNAADTQGGGARLSAGEVPEQIGRYRITGVLGEGGMGAVYAAEDPQLQRRVAIKVPHFAGSPAKQEHARKRFLREARAAAAVDHPNVCPIHDVGEHDARPFVVMALVDGESLTTRLARSTGMNATDAAGLVVKIARGLAAVHAHGIIHRDLKPANILLRRKDGEPILTDFGLAHAGDDGENLTADGAIVGTPAYMSPEQADPALGPVSARSDIYSLGVILFEMLTRRRPFEGDMMQIMSQLGTREAPRPSQFRANLEPALDAICARAMARQPAERYADANALADALTAWLGGAASPTASFEDQAGDSTIELKQPGRRRFPVPALLGGSAAAALVVSLGIYLVNRDRQLPIDDKTPSTPVAQTTDKAPTPNVTTPGLAPLQQGPITGSVDVRVWHKDRTGAGMKLNDPGALPLAPDDLIRIDVKLNRPAYCYLLWIDTEGVLSPVYPWVDQKWQNRPAVEMPVQTLHIPDELELAAPLGPGPAGIETIVLLTRDAPLGAEVDLPKLLGKLPQQKVADLRSAAWFENGAFVRHEADRGPIRLDQTKAIDDPILQTQAILRDKLGGLFKFSRAVSFSNKGDR